MHTPKSDKPQQSQSRNLSSSIQPKEESKSVHDPKGHRAANSSEQKLLAAADAHYNASPAGQLQAMSNTFGPAQQVAQLQATANEHTPSNHIKQSGRNNGLPEDLRSGIEGLSGINMSDVKVHYNSGQPAQLKAHAYARGTDIHLAPGQEKHLPHEAWHVVQQKQGRVKANTQLKAEQINDDTHLEREADSMGARALQHDASRNSAPTLQQKAANPVVQRIVNQIALDEEQKIKDINIVGRPPKSYSNSMGDHSTAYAVQLALVRLRLQGKSISEAFTEMNKLVSDLSKLPGTAFTAQLEDSQKGMLKTATADLKKIQQRYKALSEEGKEGDVYSGMLLQKYINSYLEVRELIPFSTINVMAVAPALAGKGKGESGPARVLFDAASEVDKTEETALEPEAALVAISALFDISSVSMAIAEPFSKKIKKMAQGLDKVDISKRADVYVDQHMESISQAFGPLLTYLKIGPEHIRERLMTEIRTEVLLNLAMYRDYFPSRKKGIEKRIKEINSEFAIDKRKSTRSFFKIELDKLDAEKNDIEDAKKEFNRLSKHWTEIGIDKASTIKKPDLKISVDPENESDKTAGTEEARDREKEQIAEEEKRSPLAIQLIIDKAGYIEKMESAGRSPSPFSGTMGAHTTARVVHLDRVRSVLVNKDLEHAIVLLETVLLPEAEKKEEQFTKLITGENAPDAALVATAKKSFKDGLKSVKKQKGVSLFLGMQDLIVMYLTYMNYIPGSTLYSTDTGGKSEGMYRKILLNPLQYDRDQVQKAMYGMLDLKEAPEKAKRELRKEHFNILKLTYPKAFEYINSKPSTHKKVSRPRDWDIDELDKAEGNRVWKHVKPTLPAEGVKKEEEEDFSLVKLLASEYADSIPRDFVFTDMTLVNEDGHINDISYGRLIRAYRDDILHSSAYLTEAEGHLMADHLGISLRVYQNVVPDGYVSVGNIGGGNCLIHAIHQCREFIAGHKVTQASGAFIEDMRKTISENLPEDNIRHLCEIAIAGEINDDPEPGLGPQMRMCLDDISVRAFKASREAAALLLEDMSESEDMIMEEAGLQEKYDIEKEDIIIVNEPVLQPVIQMPQIGSGVAATDVAILHTGGIHYEMIRRIPQLMNN